MARHQNKYVLQKDESVVNWHRKKACSQTSSQEEISWDDDTSFASLVNAEKQGIKALFSSLNFKYVESAVNQNHENNWQHYVYNEYDIWEK